MLTVATPVDRGLEGRAQTRARAARPPPAELRTTRNDFGTTWSKRSEYAASAAAPRSATSSQMGRTTSTAASTSNSARGTSPA